MLKDNVKHVHAELMGKIDHSRLGIRPAPLDWRSEPARTAAARANSEAITAGR
jgi:hypothetical protein